MDKIIVFLCFCVFPLLTNAQTISGPLANEPAKLGTKKIVDSSITLIPQHFDLTLFIST